MAPGSARGIVVDLELEVGGRSVRIPAHEFVESFDIESSITAAYSGTITLFDSGDTLENLFLVGGLDRKVRLRWHWSDVGIEKSPPFVGTIIRYTPTFMPQGIQFVLEIVPGSLLEAVTNIRVQSFAEGMLISDIVQQIADERGWITTDERGNPTIEPVGISINQPFSITDESVVKFIDKTLRPQAVNQAGVGGYTFYFDTFGAMHFHTRGFIPPRQKSYLFARDSAGEVMLFTPTDTNALALIAGAGNTTFRGQSSLDAAPAVKDATIATGLEDQPEVVDESATAVMDYGQNIQAIVNLFGRDALELDRLAKDVRERAKRLFFKAEMQVIGTHDVQLFDMVDVTYLRKNGQPHYLSGRFNVTKIQHSYSSGGWLTTFGMYRDGMQPEVKGTQTRQNVVTISPEA